MCSKHDANFREKAAVSLYEVELCIKWNINVEGNTKLWNLTRMNER